MCRNSFGLLSILDCLFTGVKTETKLIITIEFTINFSLNQNGTSVFFKLRSDYEKKNNENYYYIYLGHSFLSELLTELVSLQKTQRLP